MKHEYFTCDVCGKKIEPVEVNQWAFEDPHWIWVKVKFFKGVDKHSLEAHLCIEHIKEAIEKVNKL